MRVKFKEDLIYYDGPQAFLCTDEDGADYLAVAILPCSGQDYLVVRVDENDLNKFRRGQIGMRSLMLGNTNNDWYLADGEDELELQKQSGNLFEFDQLPEDGLFFGSVSVRQQVHDNIDELLTLVRGHCVVTHTLCWIDKEFERYPDGLPYPYIYVVTDAESVSMEWEICNYELYVTAYENRIEILVFDTTNGSVTEHVCGLEFDKVVGFVRFLVHDTQCFDQELVQTKG